MLLDGADDPPLAGVVDIAGFVERAERDGVLSPADLRAVSVSARVAVDARRVVHGRRDAVPLLAAIAERDRAVARPSSRRRSTVASRTTAPTCATTRRRGCASCAASCGTATRACATSSRGSRGSAGVRDALQESFLAERGGRPVLAVRASSRDQVPGIVHDASGSGQTVFIEPLAVVELGNKLAEAAARGARGGRSGSCGSSPSTSPRTARPLRALVEAVGRARPRGRARCAVAQLARRRGAGRPARCACRRAASAPRPRDRRADRSRPRRSPRARDQRPEHGREDGCVEDARPGCAAPPVRAPAAGCRGCAAGLRRGARRHRRPAVDRDEPVDVLRTRAHARRDPRVGDRALAGAAGRGGGRAPIRRRARRSRRRSSSGSRGRRVSRS